MSSNLANTPPKVFISYSWSSPEHEQFVLDLATQLRESGIDAILDKWDLREGNDADKFMERMVTDPEIKKVLIICDQLYSKKSNKREGGVGTEAQIISRRVYEQQDERKFVVASFEIDESTGKPAVPVYYGSRKYIDFTDSTRYSERFEELVRWVFDKPIYRKPQIGSTPAYIIDDEKIPLGTSAAFHRALSSLRDGRPNALGALKEYLDIYSSNLERFRINYQQDSDKPYYSLFFDSINSFLPYRNEWIEVLSTACTYSPNNSWLPFYYSFFERIHRFTEPFADGSLHRRDSEDNFKFFETELFLYFLASLLKQERLQLSADVLSHQFFNGNLTHNYDAIMDYTGFKQSIYSFDEKERAEKSNLISLHSSIMHNRANNCSFLDEIDVMQADLIAFLRSALGNNDYYFRWYPNTLLYASNRLSPFPVFARATSAEYFNKLASVLGVKGKEDLLSKYQTLHDNNHLPRWSMSYPSYKHLMNLEKLASK